MLAWLGYRFQPWQESQPWLYWLCLHLLVVHQNDDELVIVHNGIPFTKQEIGKLAGAEFILISNLIVDDGITYLSARIVAVETGQVNNPFCDITVKIARWFIFLKKYS